MMEGMNLRCIVSTFVNATKYPQYNNNIIKIIEKECQKSFSYIFENSNKLISNRKGLPLFLGACVITTSGIYTYARNNTL
jgi:hypothetical protein